MPVGIQYKAGVSAQLKSAVILAGLNSFGNTKIIEENRSRDHTENMLMANSQIIKIKNFVNYLQALIWQTVLKHARMNNMQNIALNEFSYVDINVNHISTFEQNLDIDELLQLGRDAYKRYSMN